jgi:hypothetical protein
MIIDPTERNTNMKKYGYLFPILIILSFTACTGIKGSGNVITEPRDVRDFKRVSLSGSGQLIITQGNEESLTIEAENNIMPRIKTEVKGETLSLGYERDSWKLEVIDITEAKLSGSGTIRASNVKTKDLGIDISGSGKVIIDRLVAEGLAVNLSGSGNFTLSGRVKKQEIRISGSAKYHAPELESQTVRVKISGSGKALVRASQSLDVKISGSAKVGYYGNPRLTTDISGSGSVKSLGNR